ncbi:MAG: ABC transporter permease [Caldisericaceae bacterium]|nr:ABC transporter permease [Caldisericaceae bacterium]
MNRTFKSIVRKEFLHILRDYQTLIIIFIMPIIMLIMFGYAITLEMRHIEVAVVDHARTPQSRQLLSHLQSSDFFVIKAYDPPESQFESLLQKRQVRCIMVIPADFSLSLTGERFTPVQLLIDASDPNAANFIQNYFQKISALFNAENNPQFKFPFEIVPRFLFNPNLKSEYFFVPGLIAIIVLLISALLTSIAIVREKERGTFEQILVSPVHAYQIILGKVIPYIILGFVDSVIILLIGHFWFQVPVHGSILLLLATLILYLLTGLSFGLFVSTITDSQRTAMLIALLMTILPTILLSGFIFPVPSMPVIFQYISQIIPATHFLKIIRGILLKGIGLWELKAPILYLTLLSALMIGLSIKKFKVSLE